MRKSGPADSPKAAILPKADVAAPRAVSPPALPSAAKPEIPKGRAEPLSVQDIRRRIRDRAPPSALPGPAPVDGPQIIDAGTGGSPKPSEPQRSGWQGRSESLDGKRLSPAVPQAPSAVLGQRGHPGTAPRAKPPSAGGPAVAGPKVDLQRLDHARFDARFRSGEWDHLTKGSVAQRVKLHDQYRLSREGDVARRLELHKSVAGLAHAPDARHDRHDHYPNFHHRYPYFGRVSVSFTAGCFTGWYAGPSYLAVRCWYPRWSPWVHWSWHYHCHPIWDPRPLWCRPIVYEPAPVWVYYELPVWTPLPVVSCGTWVDVAPVVVRDPFDLQLLAVRFVDPGHPEQRQGPRYRVWFRNNSERPVTQAFNVTLVASDGPKPALGAPQAGVRVTAVEAGDTQSVDIRLPFEAGQLAHDPLGQPAPFGTLHAVVDSHREIEEANRANNGAALARAEILPVDPAAFQADPDTAPAGGELVVAGEGFGPEPGKVLVHLGGLEMDAEILGWYDLGVRLRLPHLPLSGPTAADVVVVRGDGAAANPMQVTVTPP